ncbi:unnamed protein product [Miscanthus lutarioriparius]|uniref:Vacuolar membrane protease n=1 Tax=Miscanthus lutarioriparius TaxID=422564 RepID=A0A811N5U2_9POAL|nr:unnamed protein product [Miscanthus lutarioriparius]
MSGKLLTPKLSHCVNEYISVGIGIRECVVFGVAGILAGVYIGSCLVKGYNASVSHNSALAGVGAYGIEEHHWRNSVSFAVDLEAMGISESTLFQGTDHWALESFAAVAKYPSAQIASQDVFRSGAIKSATDFQIYEEVGRLPGLDFAYTDTTSVYHTKNDKMTLLKPGSLQHIGDNMLAFLLHSAASPKFLKDAQQRKQGNTEQDKAVYFDILGKYMVVYPQRLATMFHNSIILQSLLIWGTSLLMGGHPALVSFAISCLSIILMLIFSFCLPVVVAFALPYICPFPVPYVANPWLIIGLFGSPALLGAFIGQHIGFILLKRHLRHVYSRTKTGLTLSTMENVIDLEAERWIFKSGFVQWLIALILGTYFKVGSSYIALIWLVSPAFAYGFLEATLSPVRLPKQLKVVTLVLGLAAPVVSSAGLAVRMVDVIVGSIVRIDRNPGGLPDWLGNVIVSVAIAVVVCSTFVYLLSYIHISESDSVTGGARQTVVSVDTKSSTRWTLGINKEEIDDFTVQVDSEKIVLLGDKSEIDGWHTIQFAGGKNSPTKFQLTLYWSNKATEASQREAKQAAEVPFLVKLRTDVNRVTPQVARVLEKLPRWCTPFGKSTSPHTLAFLTALRVDI